VYLSLRSGTVDPRAPLVGAAFFAAAELGFWSLEPFNGGADLVVLIRRVAFIALGSLCTAVLGGLLLVLAAGVNAGLALEALGVLAAVLTLTIVAVLASRSRESTSS
jgi:hypothetical protein